MVNNKRIWICKTLRQLSFLIEKGYQPLYTIPDIKNPTKYNVWAFNRDEEGFEEAIGEWKLIVDEYYASQNK